MPFNEKIVEEFTTIKRRTAFCSLIKHDEREASSYEVRRESTARAGRKKKTHFLYGFIILLNCSNIIAQAKARKHE
jgi:hypothetical protein